MATKNNAAPAKSSNGKQTAPADNVPDGQELDSGDVDSIVTLNEGDEFTGRYFGCKKTRSAFAGKESTLHKFKTADGESVGVWGSYQLDAKLKKASEGDVLWIRYVGKSPLANGNQLHDYKVVKMADNSLPF